MKHLPTLKFCSTLALSAVVLASCVLPAKHHHTSKHASKHIQTGASKADPAKQLVVLDGAAPGWRASLILDNEPAGVWRMEPLQIFPQYATPEVVGLDDNGTCWVMVSYSGKWTPLRVLADGMWLGGLAQGDVDPEVKGKELYVGGKKGLVYQVRSYPDGGLDARRIASFPGCEIHTLAAGELDPSNDGAELLVFTRPGALYRVWRQQGGDFQSELISEINGRIRDAMLLPDGHTMVTAGRNGDVSLLRLTADELQWDVIHHVDQGRGRLALGKLTPTGLPIIYSTSDYGRIFRHEPTTDGSWRTTNIYSGPVGPRGLVAGKFHPNPAVETIAVFGYSGRVELLENQGGSWSSTTLFTDRDRGHWLSVMEADGRNNTDEIVLSGYGARMVLLDREPGTGSTGLAVPVDLDRHAKP